MKISYIAGAYIPSRGADSMHVMSMCQAFAQNGHEVTLHVRRGQELASDDYEFYGVAPAFKVVKHARPQVRAWGALVNAGLVARDFAGRTAPDLVYAREIYGLAAVLMRQQLPFIYESHWNPARSAQRATESWLLRRPTFRRIVFISAALREIYRKTFPWVPEDKMLVAHDAADAVLDEQESQFLESSRLQVGYVGGFLPGYGIDMVMRLAAVHPDLDFHVVGGKDPELTRLRRAGNSERNLTFHGFVPPSQLREYYRRFDVVLAPYQDGTAHIRWISPMKLFEYMAHGKAIVCSDFPVMGEIVSHEQDALLVPPASIEAWGNALQRLKSPSLRRRLGEAARTKLETSFTWVRRAQLVLTGLSAQ